jgi:hypothetical protein
MDRGLHSIFKRVFDVATYGHDRTTGFTGFEGSIRPHGELSNSPNPRNYCKNARNQKEGEGA